MEARETSPSRYLDERVVDTLPAHSENFTHAPGTGPIRPADVAAAPQALSPEQRSWVDSMASALAKLPPATVIPLQQGLAYAGTGPYFKAFGDWLYGQISGTPTEVAVHHPSAGVLGLTVGLALGMGFIINGARGARNIPEALMGFIPSPLRRYILEELPPAAQFLTPAAMDDLLTKWDHAGRANASPVDFRPEELIALDNTARGGLIGFGAFMKKAYGTSGWVATWALETGVSTLYVPLLLHTMTGAEYTGALFGTSFLIASVSSLSSAFLSRLSVPKNFPKTNVYRQMMFFTMNSIAMLAGKGSMPPEAAFWMSLILSGAMFGFLYSQKPRLQRVLGQ